MSSLFDEMMAEICEKNKQISDLEAKLEESEKEIKEWIAVRDDKNNVINKQTEKINQLKQQLAEKDIQILELQEQSIRDNQIYNEELAEKKKEIEQWKSMAEKSSSMRDRFNYCGESIIYDTTREQDKISFAVEQLTLFKNTIVNKMNNPYSINIKNILSDFENQIKQLKEME